MSIITPAVKLVALIKRKPGLSMAEFEHYYESSHAPMAIKHAPFMSKYTRDYIQTDSNSSGISATLEGADSSEDPPSFDVVTQLWFDTEVDFEKFHQAMVDRTIRKSIVADEERFMHRSSIRIFTVKTRESKLG
jgi:hypothetical protein